VEVEEVKCVAAIIGAIFIVGGALAFIAPELLTRYTTYFIGLGFIIVGIYLMFYGYGIIKFESTK